MIKINNVAMIGNFIALSFITGSIIIKKNLPHISDRVLINYPTDVTFGNISNFLFFISCGWLFISFWNWIFNLSENSTTVGNQISQSVSSIKENVVDPLSGEFQTYWDNIKVIIDQIRQIIAGVFNHKEEDKINYILKKLNFLIDLLTVLMLLVTFHMLILIFNLVSPKSLSSFSAPMLEAMFSIIASLLEKIQKYIVQLFNNKKNDPPNEGVLNDSINPPQPDPNYTDVTVLNSEYTNTVKVKRPVKVTQKVKHKKPRNNFILKIQNIFKIKR